MRMRTPMSHRSSHERSQTAQRVSCRTPPMKALATFLATFLGLALVLLGLTLLISTAVFPDSWASDLAARGVTNDWMLHPPEVLTGIILSAGVLLMVFGGSSEPYKYTKESTSHGSARYSTTEEVRAKGFGSRGIILGMDSSADVTETSVRGQKPSLVVKKSAPYIAAADHHVLVEGPPGAGKDECVILPTLLTDVSRSYVTLDPKGSSYRLTAGYRESYSVVKRFAPCDANTARFNPLAEVAIGTPREAIDAAGIAEVLVGSAASEDKSSHIYLSSCSTLLASTFLHVLNRRDPSLWNLPAVFTLLTQPKSVDKIVEEICSNPPASAVVALNSLKRLAEDKRMLLGAFTTALDVLKFCSMPLVAKAISGSDFVAKDLSQRDRCMSLYLEFPFRDADILRPLARLVLNGLLNHHTDDRHHNTTYLLNELPSLGNIAAIPRGLAERREYGVQLGIFVQSESQLFSAYGKEAATTILDSCQARVTLGVTGQFAAENASKRLGKATLIRPRHTRAVSAKSIFEKTITNTVGEGEQAREFMTPDEVRSMDGTDLLIDLPGLRTYRAKRAARYSMPVLNQRSQIPPPSTATLRRVV